MFNPQFSIIRQAHDADSRGSEQDRTIRNPESNGFTLVEIVVTIVIIGIISGIAAMIILQGVKVYSAEQSRGASLDW